MVQRVPRGSGVEAWRQLCREFEPHLLVRSQGMLPNLQSPTIRRAGAGERTEGLRGTIGRHGGGPTARKTGGVGSCSPGSERVPPSEAGVRGVWKHGPHRPGTARQRKKATSQGDRRSNSAGRNRAAARVSAGTSQLCWRRNALKATELADTLAWKRILRRARKSFLEEKGQAC